MQFFARCLYSIFAFGFRIRNLGAIPIILGSNLIWIVEVSTGGSLRCSDRIQLKNLYFIKFYQLIKFCYNQA